MKKDEAAKYLGISLRTLENHMTRKEVEFGYIKGKARPSVVFTQEQLDVLANSAGYSAIPVDAEIDTENDTEIVRDYNSAALAVIPPAIPASLAEIGAELRAEMFPQIVMSEGQFRELMQNREVPLTEKFSLTLAEASKVCGFSEYALRRAIKEGEIKVCRVGRSHKVLPANLKAWVETQFS